MSDPFVDFLRENWPLFAVIGILSVALYQIKILQRAVFDSRGEVVFVTKADNYNLHAKAVEWKRALFCEDGTLNYITRKEFERKMEETDGDNNLNLTRKDHDQLCENRLLKFEKSFGKLMDERFNKFEDRLFKELKLNGYSSKRSETLL